MFIFAFFVVGRCSFSFVATTFVGRTFLEILNRNIMIIMPIKEGENIERALKKFKRKYEKTGVIKELRARQYFVKPSVKSRVARLKAIYVDAMHREEE